MLARGVFELAVDIRLIDVFPDGSAKMITFTEVEKLRCARKILRFKADHPSAAVDAAIYGSFVAGNEQRIEADMGTLWPGLKRIEHWSGMKLAKRVELLKSPFDEIYEVYYPMLSWQVHSGLTGSINLDAEAFVAMCATAFRLAADSYWELVSAVIREFKIMKANEMIEKKLKAARMLPFTDSAEQAEQLLKELLH